jgi:hypothetical protein
VAIAHGVIAATALAALVLAAVRPGLPGLGKAALGVFVVAALGGAYIFLNYHMAGMPLPIPFVLLHGGLAVAGFGLLLAAIYGPRMQRLR